MGALTIDIPTVRFGVPGDGHQPMSLPVAAAAKPWGGAVAVSYKGYLVAASAPSSDQIVWGVMARTADNSLGAAGDIRGEIETGSFFLFCGTGADALDQSYVGQTVYLLDEKTVGLTASGHPQAGTLKYVDNNRSGGDKYAVTLGTAAPGTGSTP
jgi:hypothetical protein